MTSSAFRTGPLYFFDQPSRRNRIKGARSNSLHLNLAQLEDEMQSNREKDNEESQTERCGDGEADPSSAELMDAYKRAAPQLLKDVARILSQHKWSKKGRIPHGIINILNYSWEDLSAEVVNCEKSKRSMGLDEAPSRQVSAHDQRGTGISCIDPSVRKPQVSSNPRVKNRKNNSSRVHKSTTLSFSLSPSSCSNPRWIVQPKQLSCDEPQQISLCQWVVEQLQAARSPKKPQTAERDLSKPLILRYYGDAKDRKTRRKVQHITLVNGMPQIPEVKQQDPARQKLHYRINDGSSFIYYLSGCIAVCQSHSGLPCGGFYTNVFSDSECPVILATITPFGNGAVTHPLSSAITAVWSPGGGFMCDHHGNITKKWSWQTGHTLEEKIVIQVSDVISVRLLSSTSAMLSFRSNRESAQLPLSALNINQSQEMSCLQTEGTFTTDCAQDHLMMRKTKSPAVGSKRNLLTPESAVSHEVLQMVREVEELEEPSAQWRRAGHAGRELRRLQQRVRNTLDGWLDYYRMAIGIKCPDMERMSDTPLRTKLRREVQLAALPSLNPPERTDAKQDRKELQELHRCPSVPAERLLDSHTELQRTGKKRTKDEPHDRHTGSIQIHGNIKLESVITLNSAELQPSAVPRCPAPPPSFSPSIPLTVCPALLRAALLGEGGCKRCCCSATLMPVVTDLEYDAFIMGQPLHSQQILVVCVTPLPLQPVNTHGVSDQDVLEQLYRRRNKHRNTPCTQCLMDSFRLVRYEMSTGRPFCGVDNILLQQRHNAAPGMILMYMRGKLLFVGHISSGHSCSVRDLQKQISRTRADYRLGLSLPSDYKFSDTATDSTLKGGDDTTLTTLVKREKARQRKISHEVSQ